MFSTNLLGKFQDWNKTAHSEKVDPPLRDFGAGETEAEHKAKVKQLNEQSKKRTAAKRQYALAYLMYLDGSVRAEPTPERYGLDRMDAEQARGDVDEWLEAYNRKQAAREAVAA